MEMTGVEVSEICPKSPLNSSEARMLSEVRDVYNHGATLNSVAGDVNYYNCPHGQNELASSEDSSPSHRMELPTQLYSRLLMQEGSGYPLMDPALPTELPDEYQRGGVMIGDVGLVTERGYFDVLFNICEPANGNINGGWVPEGFTRLERPPKNRHNYRYGTAYHPGTWATTRDTVKVIRPFLPGTPTGAYQFECGPGEGAILTLPSGAIREDLIPCKEFLEYASVHGISWYEFVNDRLGRHVANGSIYLITGYDKTNSWGTASFFASSTIPRFTMRFTDTIWDEPGQASFKQRPGQPSPNQENQCVFLRGFKVTLNRRILSKILGVSIVDTSPMDKITPQYYQWNIFKLFNIGTGITTILQSILKKPRTLANPAALDRISEAVKPIVTATTSPLSSEIHPSHLINLYLLSKFPESDLAVTHDAVWCSYLKARTEGNKDAFLIDTGDEFNCERRNQVPKSLFEYVDAEYTAIRDNGEIYVSERPEARKTNAKSKAPMRMNLAPPSSSLPHFKERTLKSRSLIRKSKTSVNSVTTTLHDPESWIKMLEPPPDETAEAREERLIAEAHARYVSETIDADIEKQRQARKASKATKILLLGQSESGKSTTLKNFRIMWDPEPFTTERTSWRAVIQLNVVRSIQIILEALELARVQPALQGSSSQSSPNLVHGANEDLHLDPELFQLQARLGSLAEAEKLLTRRLTPLGIRDTEPTVLPVEKSRNALRELAINSTAHWKRALTRSRKFSKTSANSAESKIDEQDLVDATIVLNRCASDMGLLWKNPAIRGILNRQGIRLEDTGGFFLDSIDRVTALDYTPSNDDILRARLKTLGASEHRFTVSPATWVPYFDDMDAIIFLAPISCFNQKLAEAPEVNRLEDSVNIWMTIVENKLLKNTNIILFLNKIDILKTKLQSGIRFAHYVVSYGERPNDADSVASYLRKKFAGILKNNSVLPRPFYCHLTTVIDTQSTRVILDNVKQLFMRKNLSEAALLA